MSQNSEDGLIRSAAFTLPGACPPAPRPRIRVINLPGGKRMGVAYYVGKYKDFVVEAPKQIPPSDEYFPKGTPVNVDVTLYLPRPAKPANPYPVGDIDNYCKSILDAITKNGTYWKDDAQIERLTAVKLYTTDAPRTHVFITST
jgi:Holliday junction resolvase RusA-like endonuclease